MIPAPNMTIRLVPDHGQYRSQLSPEAGSSVPKLEQDLQQVENGLCLDKHYKQD